MIVGNVKHWKVHYGKYWHHVVDFREYPLARRMWGDRCVVELVRNPVPGVRRVRWETVVRESGGQQPILLRETTRDLKSILRRAKRRLDSRFYCVVRYNCEHFANECMTGRRRSNQVQKTTAQVFSAAGFGFAGLAFWDTALRSFSGAFGVALCLLIAIYCGWRVALLAAAASDPPNLHVSNMTDDPR
ncbi:MAG: lecithin retinol acyltransferase family protein [Planctomycetota bacterium]